MTEAHFCNTLTQSGSAALIRPRFPQRQEDRRIADKFVGSPRVATWQDSWRFAAKSIRILGPQLLKPCHKVTELSFVIK